MQTITKAKFKELYFTITQAEFAKRLGVSQPAIVYHATKLGLSKTRAKKFKVT